jgi:nucleoid DNA-binding protein
LKKSSKKLKKKNKITPIKKLSQPIKTKIPTRKDITLTREDLAHSISEKHKLPFEQSYKIIDLILNTMTQTLKKRERIEFRNFGSFYTIPIQPRAFKTKEGKTIQVPAFRKTIFRSGEGMTF